MKFSFLIFRLVALFILITSLSFKDALTEPGDDKNALLVTDGIFNLIGQCDFGGPGGQWFDIQNNYVYLTMLSGGLNVIDISDLNNPTNIYYFDCGFVFEIDVEGDYAYTSSGNGGIVIVDISQPRNFNIVKRYNTSTYYTDVIIRDTFMFLLAHKKGLEVVDISNPANPVEVSHLYENGTYSMEYMGYAHLDIKDNYVFLGHSENNFKVIDISDIQNPSTIYTTSISSDNTEVYVVNNLLFLGIRDELRIYDISNPSAPAQLTRMVDFALPSYLTMHGETLIVYDDRLVAVDMSNPSSPNIIGINNTFTHDLFFDGDFLFSSEQKFSIYKLDLSTTGIKDNRTEQNRSQNDHQLHQNYPNPFNPSTTIEYHLPKSNYVNLKIFNIAGHEIETLVHGYQTAGEYQIKWIAEGLTSGMYFYRLQVGEFLETKKLIFQK